MPTKRNKFTGAELTKLGFRIVTEGGETYYILENRYFPYKVNYLITSDGCEEDSYTVDYGYVSKFGQRQRSLTNLDEELINLFRDNTLLYSEMEEWFEKLISRE